MNTEPDLTKAAAELAQHYLDIAVAEMKHHIAAHNRRVVVAKAVATTAVSGMGLVALLVPGVARASTNNPPPMMIGQSNETPPGFGSSAALMLSLQPTAEQIPPMMNQALSANNNTDMLASPSSLPPQPSRGNAVVVTAAGAMANETPPPFQSTPSIYVDPSPDVLLPPPLANAAPNIPSAPSNPPGAPAALPSSPPRVSKSTPPGETATAVPPSSPPAVSAPSQPPSAAAAPQAPSFSQAPINVYSPPSPDTIPPPSGEIPPAPVLPPASGADGLPPSFSIIPSVPDTLPGAPVISAQQPPAVTAPPPPSAASPAPESPNSYAQVKSAIDMLGGNRTLSSAQLARLYTDTANRYNNPLITADLLVSQGFDESGFYPYAKSHATPPAQGIAQFMPGTYPQWGQDVNHNGVNSPWDPADAIDAQARFDIALVQRASSVFPNVSNTIKLNLALAMYNAGPHRLDLLGMSLLQSPPAPAETVQYVQDIDALLARTESAGGGQQAAPVPTPAPAPETGRPTHLARQLVREAKRQLAIWPAGETDVYNGIQNSNPYIAKYTHGNLGPNDEWCAWFIEYLLNKSGMNLQDNMTIGSNSYYLPSVTGMYRWMADPGNSHFLVQNAGPGTKYEPGDIIFLNWSSGTLSGLMNTASNHVAEVIGTDAQGNPITISGNYADKVTQAVFTNNIVALARPLR